MIWEKQYNDWNILERMHNTFPVLHKRGPHILDQICKLHRNINNSMFLVRYRISAFRALPVTYITVLVC